MTVVVLSGGSGEMCVSDMVLPADSRQHSQKSGMSAFADGHSRCPLSHQFVSRGGILQRSLVCVCDRTVSDFLTDVVRRLQVDSDRLLTSPALIRVSSVGRVTLTSMKSLTFCF